MQPTEDGKTPTNKKAAKNTEQYSPTGCPLSANAAQFDPFDWPYQLDPAEALRWSRDQEPVFYSPKLGYWIVSRYDDVKAVFRNNELFSPSIVLEPITLASPQAKEILNSYGYAMDRTLVNEDEPIHMERRRLLLDSFTPKALEKHIPAVRKLTRQYMDQFINKGKAELVSEMLAEIPLTVALHFLGVPEEDRVRLRTFAVAHTLNTWGQPTPQEQLEIADSVGKFWQVASEILEKMRANPSGDGWMHLTIRQNQEHPDIVTDSYLSSMMVAILVAAHETTAGAIANAMRVLLSNREVWEAICENPALIPNAIEECLRLVGSVVAWRRRVTQNTTLSGVEIPKDAKLLIISASANHDERRFENPDELDLYRENTTDHLTFGYGSHQCMGKNIGRMEMRIFLEEFIKRLPHLNIVPNQVFDYLPNTSFRGPRKLWVEWDPEQNPERKDPAILQTHKDFAIGAPSKNDIARHVVVNELHKAADGVMHLVLRDPRGRDLPNWSAGSHIDLTVGNYTRKYSLCSQHDRSCLEIAILKEEQGRGGSLYFHEHIAVGSSLHIVGPKNHFRLDEKANGYLLIAGGIGITPILAMADRLKALGKPYTLYYCGRSLSSMAFVERLKRDHGDKLRLHAKKEQGRRMDLDVVLASLQPGQQIYACGPASLLQSLGERCQHLPESTLHVEHFRVTESKLDPQQEHSFDIELEYSDITVHVPADKTVLDVLTVAGIDVPSDCSEGLCGTCEASVKQGEIDHRDRVLSKVEREEGKRMMTCCSRAVGGKITLAL